jgi:spore germination protein PC
VYPYHSQYFYAQNQSWQQKMIKLEKKIAQLQNEIETLKQEPRTTIERIEYKFDQLKIERLDGTLHLGLSPSGGEILDEFSVNDQSVQPASSAPGPYPDMTENIRRSIGDYLTGDAWSDLKQIENDHGYPLDDPYRRFILEDIRKQVDGRIRHYLNDMGPSINEKNRDEIEKTITDKVKADIYQGMVNFIYNLKQGANES